MAFKDSDKSTPKPFSDKKPDNFIQEKPFLDSDLENRVWDDISKLGGKQIAREEIDLIYRAFAEKILSISGEITSLRHNAESNLQESSDNVENIVKQSEDLAKNEKEESEKIESSISSIIDLTDITKIDEKANKHPTELDEKLLENIYKKIVKTISSPSILIPFITKISEKIYNSITQSSEKIFNELNKEFKDQMKIDIIGDIKDIAKAKEIQTIGSDKLDEEAIKRLAEREKKKDETKVKNSETIDTTKIEKIKSVNDNEEKPINIDSSKGSVTQTEEDQTTKRSFTSIREALIATQESLDESNQKIKKTWDETLKMNDLEEYSITKDKDESFEGKKKEDKNKDDKKKDYEKNSDLNFGKFALIGALAACYFLFKGYANQAHIRKYLESHPPIESIQQDINQTIESGADKLRNGLQKEIDKSLNDGDLQYSTTENNQAEKNQPDESIPNDPELNKKIEEYGETVVETAIEDHELSKIDGEAEDAKKIKRQLQDAAKENQEKFEEFQNEHRLKNAALDKEIDKNRKEAKKAGEELQTQLNDLVDKSKKTEKSVREFVNEEEQRNKYDKKITDSASGLIMTETEIISNQQKEIKEHEKFEQQLVDDQKRKDEQTKKTVIRAFEEIQEEIEGNQIELEEKLKNDPKIAQKLNAVKKQSFREIEHSGLEITDYIDKEFSRISSDVLKYQQKEDANDVIEAATENNRYIIIDMDLYQKMLNNILAIGRDALSCDNQVIEKLGQRPLR